MNAQFDECQQRFSLALRCAPGHQPFPRMSGTAYLSRERDWSSDQPEFVKPSLTRLRDYLVPDAKDESVVNPPLFGRRVAVQAQSRIAQSEAEAGKQGRNAAANEVAVESSLLSSPTNSVSLSVDQELEEWRRGRQGFKVPWRPLSLMASLCFGIASLMLPDWMNDKVQWLLYALMAASLYVGFSKRRRPANG